MKAKQCGLPKRDAYSTLHGNATSFSVTVSSILNKKQLSEQASKQKCLPPSKNLSRYISAALQQTYCMRDLSGLGGGNPLSVIWWLVLHHTAELSAKSCTLLPTDLCPLTGEPDGKPSAVSLRLPAEELQRQLRALLPRLTPASEPCTPANMNCSIYSS